MRTRLPLQAAVFLFGEVGGTCCFVFILRCAGPPTPTLTLPLPLPLPLPLTRYADPLLISVVLLLTPVAALIEGIGFGLSSPPGILTLLAVGVMLLGVAAVVVGGNGAPEGGGDQLAGDQPLTPAIDGGAEAASLLGFH